MPLGIDDLRPRHRHETPGRALRADGRPGTDAPRAGAAAFTARRRVVPHHAADLLARTACAARAKLASFAHAVPDDSSAVSADRRLRGRQPDTRYRARTHARSNLAETFHATHGPAGGPRSSVQERPLLNRSRRRSMAVPKPPLA